MVVTAVYSGFGVRDYEAMKMMAKVKVVAACVVVAVILAACAVGIAA